MRFEMDPLELIYDMEQNPKIEEIHPETEKLCKACNLPKPLTQFSKDTAARDGKRAICKICDNERKKEYRKGFVGRAKILIRRCEDRAKENSWEFDLDLRWLERQYCRQLGRCLKTGILLDFESEDPVNLFAPSLDRIDSSKGYTKENTNLVALFWNLAKNKVEDGVFEKLFEHISKSFLKKRGFETILLE
jgi:hypothetical protein